MSASFERFRGVVAHLRGPTGCPWDREQTHMSLLPPLLEETYEVVGAIKAADDRNLREELGDLLLQVVLHAQIAHEEGRFDIDDVLDGIAEKLVRRHPHVFADSEAGDSDAVVKQWDAIKRDEKKNDTSHYLADLPTALPGLMRAQKAQSKAARVNFDWTDPRDVLAKVEEELRETQEALAAKDEDAVANEIGDLLFAVVNLARKNKLNAEVIMQAATDKFVARFNRMEDELKSKGKRLGDVGLAELDAIWNVLKREPVATSPSAV